MNNKNLIIPKYSAILCLLVILIHNSIPAYFDYNGILCDDVLHYIITRIIPCITSIAVPSFFVLSGYLFYLNYNYSKTFSKYKSRFYSLVIPYVVFNVCGTFLEMFMKLPFFASMASVTSEAMDPFIFRNFIIGLLFHKFTVLWFVFALIIYSYLCPIIYLFLKNKYIGAIVIIISFILIGFGYIHITLPDTLYFDTKSILYYLIGAYLGCHYKSFFFRSTSIIQANISLIVLCVIVGCQLIFNLLNITYILITVLKVFSFWYICSYLCKNTKSKEWHKYSFFIYLTHLTIIRFASGLLRTIFNRLFDSFILEEFILYSLSFLITVYTCVKIATLWRKFHYSSFNFVTGGR